LTPDPKYLFASESHKEALAHIAYGIEERRGFVLILGEVGTGKTTLIRHVLKRFGPDIKSVFVFNPNLGFEELLQAVLRDLEAPIPSRRRVDLIDALNEFLLQENAAGRRVVLIIDEAQHLSASVLEDIRMLSNLETARSKLLQIVLVGQPELGERLGEASLRQLRQRIGLAAALNPLNRNETAAYVTHRLAVAGRETPIFTRLALQRVHRNSGGIPRLVNVICDKALILGYAANKPRIGRRIIRQVVRDWEVFRRPSRKSGQASPSHRPVEHRFRRPKRRMAIGSVAAAVAVGVLLVTGVLVVRLGVPDYTTAAGLLAPPATSPEPQVQAPKPPHHATDSRAPSEPGSQPASAVFLPGAGSPPPPAEPDPAERSQASTPAIPVASLPGPGGSLVNVNNGDTLSWLVYRAYGRSDETLFDIVQRANPDLDDVDRLKVGQRLRLPPLAPEAMVHRVASGRYVVHLLTTPTATDSEFLKLRAGLQSAGRRVRLEPVRLGSLRSPSYRVWVGDFATPQDAEAFYRRMHSGEAA
jgi:general secretion pathway protein A